MQRGIAIAHGFLTGKEIAEDGATCSTNVWLQRVRLNEGDLMLYLPDWSARNLICILN